MAITFTALTGAADVNTLSSYSTASISPSSNVTLFLAIIDRTSSGANATPPAISGLSLTWNLETVFDSTNNRWFALYWAQTGDSPGSGSITIDYSGQDQECQGWSVFESSEPVAVVQSVIEDEASETDKYIDISLATFKASANAVIGAFHIGNDNQNPSVGSGFTLIHAVDVAPDPGGDHTLFTEYKSSEDTVVDMSWTGSYTGGIQRGLAFEITPTIKDIIGSGYIPFAR